MAALGSDRSTDRVHRGIHDVLNMGRGLAHARPGRYPPAGRAQPGRINAGWCPARLGRRQPRVRAEIGWLHAWRPRTHSDDEGGHRLRVIVGVDGSPQSAHALSWACRRGETCGDTIRAVCAWSLGASGEDWMVQPDVSAEGQRYAERVLREVVERARTDHPAVKVETAVIEGPPARVLVDLPADADLLVVGSRGRGGFSGLLLGSVSQQCIHHAHCPVTVVR